MDGSAIFPTHSSCVPILVSRSSRRPVPRQNTAGVPLLVSRAPGFSPPCHNASFKPILVFRAPSFCGLLITLSAHRTLPPAASASSTPRVSRPREAPRSVKRKRPSCRDAEMVRRETARLHHTRPWAASATSTPGVTCPRAVPHSVTRTHPSCREAASVRQEIARLHHTQHRFEQKAIAAGRVITSGNVQHNKQRLMRSSAARTPCPCQCRAAPECGLTQHAADRPVGAIFHRTVC